MTLYTAVPIEFVLDGIEQLKPTITVEALGVKMEVMPVSPGIGQIVRLLECKLDDYLNPLLTPGAFVHYSFSD